MFSAMTPPSLPYLVLAASLWATAAIPHGGPPAHVEAPSPEKAPSPVEAPSSEEAPGVIEGRLDLRLSPPRRTVDRYPARGATAPSTVQPIPAVVYLTGAESAALAPATVEMAQEDTTFSPPVVVVRVGGSVVFPNHDPFFHNVFSYSSPGRFDLGRYPMGESKVVRFDEPGVVKVYCEVHESMRGAILVTGNGHWVTPGADGRFRLEGVPAGRWTLVAWHADLGEARAEVVVPDGGTASVSLTLG